MSALLRLRRKLGPRAFAAALVLAAFVVTRALAIGATEAGAARMTPRYQLAFFPLYGLLVRALARGVGNVFWAAFLLSNLSALIAALLIVELGKLARPADGLRAAVLFLASPGAHFVAYPYTEALFAALLAAALLLLRSQRFLLAALPGAAASAVRSPGIAAAVALFAHGWAAWRRATPSPSCTCRPCTTAGSAWWDRCARFSPSIPSPTTTW